MISQIINHFTDNDLYAFTMSYAGQRYQNIVEDELIIRKPFKVDKGFVNELRRQIDLFANLTLTDDEAKFIKQTCYYLPPTFVDWLKTYRFDPSEVTVWLEGNVLKLKIKGLFYRTVFWETPLMALISELFYIYYGYKAEPNYTKKAEAKGKYLRQIGAIYSEFGTRRRFSYDVQKNNIIALVKASGELRNGGVFVGTSNVHFAHILNLIPTGTNAHKWYQLHAGLFGVRMANTMALKVWEETYGTWLGTALTDTYTTKEFLSTFTRHDANLYESLRQDSGNPFTYIDLILDFYTNKVKIKPMSKTILFSDSLNLETVEKILNACHSKINCAFGIGTYFTNDMESVEALKIVIKQIAVYLLDGRRIGTCKLSDDPQSKSSGEPDVVYHSKFEIGLI